MYVQEGMGKLADLHALAGFLDHLGAFAACEPFCDALPHCLEHAGLQIPWANLFARGTGDL